MLWRLPVNGFLIPSFILHLQIGIFLEGALSLLPHLFICLTSIHSLSFYCMGYNLLLSLFCCSNWPKSGHWDSFQVGSVSFWDISIEFWALSYFLAEQNVPGISCTLSVLTLGSVISPMTLVSFGREWHLEDKIWMLVVFILNGLCVAFSSLRRQSQEIYDKIRKYTLIYFCFYPYPYICLSIHLSSLKLWFHIDTSIL